MVFSVRETHELFGKSVSPSLDNTLLELPFDYVLQVNPGGGSYSLQAKDGTVTTGADAGALITSAIAAGGKVYIRAGTYVCTTAILVAVAGTTIQGDGMNTTILQFDGSVITTGLIKMTDTTVRAYISIKDLEITSSVVASGLGINMDYFTLSKVENVILDSLNKGIDISNGNSFYNFIENVRCIIGGAGGFGIRLAKNEQTVFRTRISASDSNNVTGIIVNAHGIGLISCNVESGVNVVLVGVDIQSAGHDTFISDAYLEANATNLKLAASVKAFLCIGSFIADGVAADITDGGATDPCFISDRKGTGTYTQFTSAPNMVGTEFSNTPQVGANDTIVGLTTRKYTFYTLPTTAPFYRVTAIEWLNGTVVNSTVFCGIEIVDTNPPTLAQVAIVAWSRALAQSGASAVQKNSFVSSLLIPGGSIIGVYIATNSATARFGTTTVASNNNTKILSGTPVLADTTAWTASTEEPYIKLYIKPVFATT